MITDKMKQRIGWQCAGCNDDGGGCGGEKNMGIDFYVGQLYENPREEAHAPPYEPVEVGVCCHECFEEVLRLEDTILIEGDKNEDGIYTYAYFSITENEYRRVWRTIDE